MVGSSRYVVPCMPHGATITSKIIWIAIVVKSFLSVKPVNRLPTYIIKDSPDGGLIIKVTIICLKYRAFGYINTSLKH